MNDTPASDPPTPENLVPVKRLEIIIDGYRHREVTDLLKRAGATGHSVIRQVTGAGDRGEQSGDELTGSFTNVAILCACPPHILNTVLPELRLILQRHGGLCLVTDAHELQH